MGEFEQKDYEAARSCADAIQNNATNIMVIFDSIENHMKMLYGDAWQSSGADVSNERYQVLRREYEVFYNKVITMRNHIYNVTNVNESTDSAISQNIAGI